MTCGLNLGTTLALIKSANSKYDNGVFYSLPIYYIQRPKEALLRFLKNCPAEPYRPWQ